MYITKSTLILALVGLTAKLVVAIPPACVLAAVNTQPNPADLQSICGDKASQVQAQLQALCNGDDLDAALTEFSNTCKAAGQTVSSVSSSASSTSSESATTSSTSSGSATTSEASSESDSVTSDSSSAAGFTTVVATSTYYDTSCSCTKTAVVGGATGPAVYPSNTGAATGGPSGPGNVTIPTGPSSPPSSPSATQSTFTGAAPRSMAGSVIGVVLVAAGFAIAL